MTRDSLGWLRISSLLALALWLDPQNLLEPHTAPVLGPTLPSASVQPPETDSTLLRPGEVRTRKISGRGSDYYRVDLAADQFLRLTAIQQGVDLILHLRDPDGHKILTVDSPNGSTGPETLEFLSESKGFYSLEVSSQDRETVAGSYRLQIDALRRASERDRLRSQGATWFSLGEHQRRRTDRPSLDEAVLLYENALDAWTELGDTKRSAETLQRLGTVHYTLGSLSEAQVFFERALADLLNIDDRVRQAEVNNSLGLIQLQTRSYTDAETSFRNALRLAESSANLEAQAAALNNLAMLNKQQIRLFEAVELYQQSLTAWRQVGSARQEAITLNNLGSLYSELWEFELARDYFEKSLELSRSLNDPRREAIVLNNLGVLSERANEVEASEEFLIEALALWDSLGEQGRVARILNNLGQIYWRKGRTIAAVESYDRSVEQARLSGDRYTEVAALNNLGRLHSSLGEHAKAEELQRYAWGLAEDLPRHQKVKLLHSLARTLQLQDRLPEARQLLELALEVIDSLSERIPSRHLRARFLRTRHEVYELYIELLMREYFEGSDTESMVRAFEVSQEGRARDYLDLLAEARVVARPDASPDLLAAEKRIQAQINTNELRRKEYLLAGNTIDTVQLTREQRGLLDQLAQVRTQLLLDAPRRVAWARPLGSEEIQQRILDSETVLIHYELAEPRSYVWIVSSESIHGLELPNRTELEVLAQQVVRSMPRSHYLSPRGIVEQSGWDLSQTILHPLEPLIGAKKRLVIVAEGALEYVPFAALPLSTRPGQPDETLIERFELVRQPTISILASESAPPRTPTQGVVGVLADPVFHWEDPRVQEIHRAREHQRRGLESSPRDDESHFPRLPGSRREAARVLDLIPPGQGVLFAGFEASRETFLSGRLDGFSILHLATHSVIDSQHPDLSGIVLSKVGADGLPREEFVWVHEIYNLSLPSELVVLSSCESGLGRNLQAQGFQGLTQAFSYAGARRVLVTLWPIDDDATAELMEQFYREMLLHGQAPASALRNAQLKLAENPRWQAPYYWAGFVLLGDWRAFLR